MPQDKQPREPDLDLDTEASAKLREIIDQPSDPSASAANLANTKRALLERYERERRLNQQTDYMARICLNTRVPSKWRFADVETGEVWQWFPTTFEGHREGGTFRRVYDVEVRMKGERS